MANWRIKSLDAILATAEKKSLHRSLGAVQLTFLGIGGIIGTGIFVLTAEAAQVAGPGMLLSFVLSALVCGLAALCYAELAAMVPVAGSAYTYSYATFGEVLAWVVGWALVLEYAVAASAVAVGWSGYAVGVLRDLVGIHVPDVIANGDGIIARMTLLFTPSTPELQTALAHGGLINLPAVIIALAVTALLVVGTKESATVNAVLVCVKIAALAAFIALSVPAIQSPNFIPFAPLGTGGIISAASIIFFAFVGFDAVSTAAEETKDPQRNVPIGLIGSLVICTIFYMLVGAGAIGSYGAQPIIDAAGHGLTPGSPELTARCASLLSSFGDLKQPIVCSKEALAHVLKATGHPAIGNMLGLAAGFALPSVVLMMMYAQTRIFFVMSRDGLLPTALSKVHPRFKTPHIVTIVTGVFVTIAAAFFPVGQLASVSNGGTLCAFFFVALAIMALRRSNPERRRAFRTPAVWVVAPLAAAGCILLFLFLSGIAKAVFFGWAAIGLVFYFLYGRTRSNVARGIVETHELDAGVPPQGVAPMPGAPTPGGYKPDRGAVGAALAALAAFHGVAREALRFVSTGLALSSLDGLAVDVAFVARLGWRRLTVYRHHPRARADRLSGPGGPMAIIVPAWDEADVIGAMLARFAATQDYPDYRLFVGVYPNDDATRAAVASVADPRISIVACTRPGPTTKADCLNHLWRAVLADEAGIR